MFTHQSVGGGLFPIAAVKSPLRPVGAQFSRRQIPLQWRTADGQRGQQPMGLAPGGLLDDQALIPWFFLAQRRLVGHLACLHQ